MSTTATRPAQRVSLPGKLSLSALIQSNKSHNQHIPDTGAERISPKSSQTSETLLSNLKSIKPISKIPDSDNLDIGNTSAIRKYSSDTSLPRGKKNTPNKPNDSEMKRSTESHSASKKKKVKRRSADNLKAKQHKAPSNKLQSTDPETGENVSSSAARTLLPSVSDDDQWESAVEEFPDSQRKSSPTISLLARAPASPGSDAVKPSFGLPRSSFGSDSKKLDSCQPHTPLTNGEIQRSDKTVSEKSGVGRGSVGKLDLPMKPGSQPISDADIHNDITPRGDHPGDDPTMLSAEDNTLDYINRVSKVSPTGKTNRGRAGIYHADSDGATRGRGLRHGKRGVAGASYHHTSDPRSPPAFHHQTLRQYNIPPRFQVRPPAPPHNDVPRQKPYANHRWLEDGEPSIASVNHTRGPMRFDHTQNKYVRDGEVLEPGLVSPSVSTGSAKPDRVAELSDRQRTESDSAHSSVSKIGSWAEEMDSDKEASDVEDADVTSRLTPAAESATTSTGSRDVYQELNRTVLSPSLPRSDTSSPADGVASRGWRGRGNRGRASVALVPPPSATAIANTRGRGVARRNSPFAEIIPGAVHEAASSPPAHQQDVSYGGFPQRDEILNVYGHTTPPPGEDRFRGPQSIGRGVAQQQQPPPYGKGRGVVSNALREAAEARNARSNTSGESVKSLMSMSVTEPLWANNQASTYASANNKKNTYSQMSKSVSQQFTSRSCVSRQADAPSTPWGGETPARTLDDADFPTLGAVVAGQASVKHSKSSSHVAPPRLQQKSQDSRRSGPPVPKWSVPTPPRSARFAALAPDQPATTPNGAVDFSSLAVTPPGPPTDPTPAELSDQLTARANAKLSRWTQQRQQPKPQANSYDAALISNALFTYQSPTAAAPVYEESAPVKDPNAVRIDNFVGRFDTCQTGFIDSHCHIDFIFKRTRFIGTWSQYREQHSGSFARNYEGCIAVFCDPRTFVPHGQWRTITQDQQVWGAMGCHPKNAHDWSDSQITVLEEILKNPKMVALGEVGLDYSTEFFYKQSPRQKAVLRQHIRLALKLDKPIVIHSRDSDDDCFDVLNEELRERPTQNIHRHCFTGTWAVAQKWLARFPNLFIGLTPLITGSGPRTDGPRDVARNIPISRLLIETDAPYFVPNELTGCMEFSHPGMAVSVAEYVSRARNLDLEQVLAQVRRNTIQMYRLHKWVQE